MHRVRGADGTRVLLHTDGYFISISEVCMTTKQRIEKDITIQFIENSCRQYGDAHKLAVALGKPVFFMGKLAGMFQYMNYFKSNEMYPQVLSIETRVPYWADESPGALEPAGYITESKTKSITLSNGKRRVVVPGAVVVYIASCIAAGSWVPTRATPTVERIIRECQYLVDKRYHLITEEDTWGLS